MIKDYIVIDRVSGQEINKIIAKKNEKYLVELVDGNYAWRDEGLVSFFSKSKWLSSLKQRASEKVIEAIGKFIAPRVVRAITNTFRETENFLVFGVHVEFIDIGGFRPSFEVPILFEKKSMSFLKPNMVFYQQRFWQLNQEFFDKWKIRVPRFLNFNKFSPSAPQIVRFFERFIV